MKKVMILLLLILCSSLWCVEVEIEGNNATIYGDFNIEKQLNIEIEESQYSELVLKECRYGGMPQLPAINYYTKLLSLPENGSWILKDISYGYEEIDISHQLINNSRTCADYIIRDEWIPEIITNIGEPIIMRQNRFSQISVAGMQYNPAKNKVRIIKNLQVDLKIDESNSNNTKEILANVKGNGFFNLTENIIGHTQGRSSEKGSYLIICPDVPEVLDVLAYLKNWKQKLGYNVSIATLSETGDTNELIREYIQNAYDNWENAPEYVLLVGDVSGNIQLPSWYIAGYLTSFDVTDHPYTLLEGDDYFPDVLIGRLSVQSVSQLQTVISKIINYESNPFMGSDWVTRALMCSFVMDAGGYYQMYSQRETVMAIRENLLDFTYAEVDTFISPWQTGASNLANMINTGYSFINYRGAGSPSYWSSGYGTMFHVDNFTLLQNGFMLPMVTSIVCGGGNFADAGYQNCFGECWLVSGTPQNPSGGIAFIGPSELDTKTPFNNCNDMGIYQGITQEGIYGTAEMMLRGKMELYNNYPDCHQMDGYNDAWDSDMFYFYVYNLLGDPGLKIWTDTPMDITANIPEYVSETASQITISTDDISAEIFTASLTYEGELFDVCMFDSPGSATLNIPEGLEEFEVTLSAYGYIPSISLITRTNQIQEVTVQDYSFEDELYTGSSTQLHIDIENTTSTLQDSITIEFSSSCEGIEMSSVIQTIYNLDPGQTDSIVYDIVFPEEYQDIERNDIMFSFNNGMLGQYQIEYDLLSPRIDYWDYSAGTEEDVIIPGIDNNINIELYNSGNKNSESFTAILASMDEKCTISNAVSYYDNIPSNTSSLGNEPFIICPDASVISGEPMLFDLTVIQSNRPVWQIQFQLIAGEVNENSPSFSSYGYYAIESSDSGNFNAPEYNWIEICPDEGGSGNLIPENHVTSDGFSTCIDLPFEFCYYSQFYNEITVSSNGWLAMGEEEFVFFRNRTIPSGVGVNAMIAPFWDEMSGGEIYSWYNSYDHYFVIEWYNFQDSGHGSTQTFQVILYDPEFYPTASSDGMIKFQYQEINNNDQEENYATIGIENHLQTEGLLLSFADHYPRSMHEIEDETAILFTIKDGNPVPQISVDSEEITVSIYADSFYTCEVSLENLNEVETVEYEIGISHFPMRSSEGSRDIGEDTINPITTSYYTSHEMDLYAFLMHDTPDNEAIEGVQITFPDYINVNRATDISQMHYNGESGYGAVVSWGFGNGNNYNNPLPQTFHIYFTVDTGINSPIPLEWMIMGDGTGEEPHVSTGTINLFPSSESFIWVEYPNGGEELAFAAEDTIKWASYGEIDEVDIYYTDNYFVNYTIVAEDIENTGEHIWTVPSELTDHGKVRVRESNGNEYDDSDGLFFIRGLVVTYPNSETILEYGTEAEILWDFSGGAADVDIDISTDGGMFWHTLVNNAPNTGSYSFIVDLPPSDECKVRLMTYAEEQVISIMDGFFTVVDSPVNWLNASPSQGSITPLASQTIELSINTSGMEPGRYEAYLSVMTNFGQKLAVPVLLEVLSVDNMDDDIIPQAVLENNYPNPFYAGNSRGNTTTISFSVNKASMIKLAVYNVKGQRVRLFVDEELPSGKYDITWDGSDEDGKSLAAGVYFYQLKVDDSIAANKKCLLLK